MLVSTLGVGCSCPTTRAQPATSPENSPLRAPPPQNLLIAVCAACIGTDTEYPWRTVLTMASVVGGLGGGTTITLLGAFAYLADCCPPKDRALSFTLIEAFYGVGSLAAYFGGGYISKDRGETATLLIVAAWLGAVCLYIVVIPESITPEKQVALQWRKLHSLQALVGFVKTGPNDLPGARLTRCALAAAFVTAFLGFLGGFSVTTLFFKGARYHWDDGKIGIYNGVCQAGRSFTVFLAPTIEWLSPSDRQKRGLVQVFLVVFAACNIATPWARPPGTVYALGGVAGLVLPTCFGYLRSMVSRAFADEAQGEGLAGLAFIEGLDTLLSALIFNSVFDVHARGLPDGSAAWFAIGASAVLASATLFAVFPSPNELVVAKIPTGASGRGVPGSDGEETPLLGPSDNTLVN